MASQLALDDEAHVLVVQIEEIRCYLQRREWQLPRRHRRRRPQQRQSQQFPSCGLTLARQEMALRLELELELELEPGLERLQA